MMSGSDQHDELCMLDGDNKSIPPDSPQGISEELTVQLECFDCSMLVRHSHTP